jgi:hypothetical protein
MGEEMRMEAMLVLTVTNTEKNNVKEREALQI